MSAKIICGSLFDSDAQYIAHQCNSVTTTGAHLARSMFKEFPHADIYKDRVKMDWRDCPDKPGTIIIRGNGEDKRYVINMIGQLFPGKPKFPDSYIDGSKARQKYFRQCLIRILEEIKDLKSIAFPWRIACGAAGGDWDVYMNMINGFSEYVKGDVVIYRREIDWDK